MQSLEAGRSGQLTEGTKVLTKGWEGGSVRPGSNECEPIALDEHIVFDNTLFSPPGGTKHSQIQGELGHFRLDLGDGYLLHGTPYAKSIGASPSARACVNCVVASTSAARATVAPPAPRLRAGSTMPVSPAGAPLRRFGSLLFESLGVGIH